MISNRRRAAVCAGLAAVLSVGLSAGTVGAASAAPKKPAPAVTKVAAQVLLRVNPVQATPETGDHTATVRVKAPARTVVTGTYQLLDGGVVVASGTLAAGTAKVVLDLEPGTHKLTAVYGGAAKINRAATRSVVVVPAEVVAPVEPETPEVPEA